MSIEAVVKFLEATSGDESLRKELTGILGVGDGNLSSAKELDHDEADALLGRRSVQISAFAEQRGYEFTIAELNAVIGLMQKFQANKISETEFSKALGIGSSEKHIEKISHTVGMVYMGVKYDEERGAKSEPGNAHQVLDFMKKTSEDAELREKLKSILSVGDGDISDFSNLDPDEAKALTGERGALVAEFGAKHGFVFTLADLLAVIDAFKRLQSNELTSDEFEKFLDLEVQSKDYFPFIQNVVSMTYLGKVYNTPIISKSKDNTLPVIRFMELSGSDTVLQGKLKAILGGDGDISKPGELDAAEAIALGGDKGAEVVKLGAEYGYRFSKADLGAVVGAFQMVNNGTLPMESCARILGLGKSESAVASVKKASGVYRGVAF